VDLFTTKNILGVKAMNAYFIAIASLMLMQACRPGPEDSRLKILGYEKNDDIILVNLDLKAYNSSDIPMFFGVSDEEIRVLSLQLDNGMEIEPDVSKTLELPRSCAHIHYQVPDIEVVCQVAFKIAKEKNPKQLFYRWAGGSHFVEVGDQFKTN